MASASVIGALKERYETFTINSTAKLYFHEAPLVDGSGNQVNPPYVVLMDDGTEVAHEFEENPIETTRVRFEVYATTLASADSIASAIRYNGGTITAGSGMDSSESLPLTGMDHMNIDRLREQRWKEGARGTSATPVYRCSMQYEVVVKRTA